MPATKTNVATVATKTRRVRQPKKPAFVASGIIIVPTAYDIALYTNSLYMPTPADIDQYGRADKLVCIGELRDEAEHENIMRDTMPLHVNAPHDPRFALVPVQPHGADDAATSTVPDLTERLLAKRAAALAVREFYPGPSLPFKAAADLRYRAAINFARFTPGSISGTERTAAALAAILCYCNVAPDGTFVRGSGAVPRVMLGLPADPAHPTLAAGIESGVLSRLIGTGAISYVSGAIHGIGAENAVYRVNLGKARANMQAHNTKRGDGEHAFSRPLALLAATVTG